ncbi:MAG: trypsin-like peptidase domain-containing protein [Pseudomonadota bacterium]
MTRALLFLVLAGPALADPAPLAAVGKLDLRGEAACSGTLIAPDLVLTAGHCLKGDPNEPKFEPGEIVFRPGRTPGQKPPDPIAGLSMTVHPFWDFRVGPRGMRMAFDLGVLRLAEPVSADVARPLDFGGLPDLGEAVLVASYRGGRGEIARQRRCPVIEANHAVAGLGCPVDFGESGSPMLRLGDDGPLIVGVLANKGIIEGQPVGFGPVTLTGVESVIEHLENIEALESKQNSRGLEAAN